ncbi:MAG TPA: hypothetical protein PLI20_09325, partial [Bacillota bacterium]|nr:hypothetical protein [Bacillota bacterium]
MYLRKGCSRQERGAITVFLAIVFTSLIIFAGVIIDIVRIAAAERKVQSILNSSARSVLAGYDSELTGSYGIYGINVTADGIKDDFYRYVSVNIKERHEGISFIDIKVDREDVEIQGLDGLLKDDIFKKQIQEYMKYRTPIKIAETLIEQFKNIRLDKKVDFANGEKVTRDKARELRIKTNEVNAKLEGIKKKITDLSAEKLEEIKDELSEVLTISNLIYGANGEGLLDEYIQSREETNNKARQGECIENRSEEFGGVKENCESLAPELQKCLAEVDKTLFIVKPLQKELKLLNEELDDLKDDLEKLRKKLSKIEKDDDSFSEEADSIRDEMDDIGDEMDRVEGKIEQLESRIENEVYELKKRYERFSLKGYTLKGEAVQLADKKAEELKKS